MGNRIMAAAVQHEARIGDVAVNLERIESLCREALSKDAKLIALPEFFTSRVVYDPQVQTAVLPPDNEAVDLMKSLANKHECWIGGSMLIAEGDDVYNRYHFVEPDGTIHRHDKDLPTCWENASYGPGKPGDDGAFDTGMGGVGVAVCWELIRTQTVKRLIGNIDVAVTGSHWWSFPDNWGSLASGALASSAQYNRYLSENAPVEFARRLGVPVLQSLHCGKITSGFPLIPGTSLTVPYDTEFFGYTQIIDAHGHVLAQRQAQEGPGVVVAEIETGAIEPVVPIEKRFWIPNLELMLKLYWHHQNACGRSYYEKKGRAEGIRYAEKYLSDRS